MNDKEWFIIAQGEILEDGLSILDAGVYGYVNSYKSGQCWRSREYLSKKLNITKSKLDASVKRLVDRGWFVVEQARNPNNPMKPVRKIVAQRRKVKNYELSVTDTSRSQLPIARGLSNQKLEVSVTDTSYKVRSESKIKKVTKSASPEGDAYFPPKKESVSKPTARDEGSKLARGDEIVPAHKARAIKKEKSPSGVNVEAQWLRFGYGKDVRLTRDDCLALKKWLARKDKPAELGRFMIEALQEWFDMETKNAKAAMKGNGSHYRRLQQSWVVEKAFVIWRLNEDYKHLYFDWLDRRRRADLHEEG